jgi:histidyl-tRNA synthetase
MARELRKQGIVVEVYPGSVKLKKQLDYANSTRQRFALILGDSELRNGTVSIKDLKNGSQEEISQDSILNFLQNA